MLVVLSDLHFEEERSSAIVPAVGAEQDAAVSDGNIGPEAFGMFVRQVEELAVDNEAVHIDLVFAGDIFDLNRTALWLEDGAADRPYVSSAEVTPGSPMEARLLRILDAIADERKVAPALRLLRGLGAGGLPADTTRHYIPGNHDRLANATPAIRRRVRDLLGAPDGDRPFPHHLLFDDPRVLVRHGHEYDPDSFSVDYSRKKVVPLEYPEAEYAEPTLDDFIAVDVVTRLAWQFRRHHRDDAILRSGLLAAVYRRLLDCDDVRPAGLMLRYVLAIPGHSARAVWRALAPPLRELLSDLHDSPLGAALLERLPRAQGRLIARFVRDIRRDREITLGEIRALEAELVSRPRPSADPVAAAAREEVVRDGRARFVVAGHTHAPRVALLRAGSPLERWYVDTGTWRHRVMPAADGSGFGRVKALSYAVVWASYEDRGADAASKSESLDYWEGLTYRWPT